jgi:hypothetical protein
MKKILALSILATPLVALATNWTNFPVVTAPNSSNTFLIGTMTTNEQISAGNLLNWLAPSFQPASPILSNTLANVFTTNAAPGNAIPISWTNQANFIAGLGGSNIVGSAFLSATPYEYWVGTNNIGLNLGTRDDPFQATNESSFEALLDGPFAKNNPKLVHLGAGVFAMRGWPNHFIWPNTIIEGAGESLTTISNAATGETNSQGVILNYAGSLSGGDTIEDLTVDASGENNAFEKGISLVAGNDNHVIHCLVKNCIGVSANGWESFSIVVEGVGSSVEDCVVTNLLGNYTEGIMAFGCYNDKILDNWVYGNGTNQYEQMYGGGGTTNTIFAHNHSLNGSVAWYCDTGHCEGLSILDNQFINPQSGIQFNNASGVNSSLIEGNYIVLTNNTSQYSQAVSDDYPGLDTNNMWIGNTFLFGLNPTPTNGNQFIFFPGGVFAHNMVDNRGTIDVNQYCTPYDNNDQTGQPHPGVCAVGSPTPAWAYNGFGFPPNPTFLDAVPTKFIGTNLDLGNMTGNGYYIGITNGPITITLSHNVFVYPGEQWVIQKCMNDSTNVITITGSPGKVINGQTSIYLTNAWQAVTIIGGLNGTNHYAYFSQ